MLTDMHVLESGGMILLDVPAETLESTIQRLEQFIFTEDVRVGSLAESLSGVWLHGPRAACRPRAGDRWRARLERVAGVSPHAVRVRRIPGIDRAHQSTRRARVLRVPGTSARRRALVVRAHRGRVPSLFPTTRSRRRGSKSAYPVFGLDMTDDTIPLEAGIESRAISFTKGCYVGQEVIIRVLHRGHGRVAKKLVSLRIDGQRPERGAKLYAGDREVGS